MSDLSHDFEKCARDILREAVGEEPPADWFTGLLEQMIQEVVKPSGRVSTDMTMNAIRASGAMAHGKARELTDTEIRTVIGRHFELK